MVKAANILSDILLLYTQLSRVGQSNKLFTWTVLQYLKYLPPPSIYCCDFKIMR